MSSPARSWSLITTASASWNFSRKRTSSMQVSSGRPHILTSNQRGRGNDPVTVLGRIKLAVAVNMEFLLPGIVPEFAFGRPPWNRDGPGGGQLRNHGEAPPDHSCE